MESYKNINPRVTRAIAVSESTDQDKFRQALLFTAVTWLPITLAAVVTQLA